MTNYKIPPPPIIKVDDITSKKKIARRKVLDEVFKRRAQYRRLNKSKS